MRGVVTIEDGMGSYGRPGDVVCEGESAASLKIHCPRMTARSGLGELGCSDQ